MAATIWTVGHSTHPIERFLRLLGGHGIEALADIRRFPTSRWPQFTQVALREALGRAGIGYVHVPELGGYRKGGYGRHVGSEEFGRGIARLLDLASRNRTAIMCAEAVFFRCHRRHVADALVSEGHRVTHIYPDGRTQDHEARATLDTYR